MGLDMYLNAKRYVSEYTDKELSEKVNSLDFGQKQMKINEVSAEAMYWRKANAIHSWFVRECQVGVDECQETHVPIVKLVELRDLCRTVLANRKKAAKFLPTSSGFFFGDIEYDEWYFNHIERTEKELTEIVEDEELATNWTFYYQSSW
jgi:hypothetical protein